MSQLDSEHMNGSNGTRKTLIILVIAIVGVVIVFMLYSHLPRASSAAGTSSDLVTPVPEWGFPGLKPGDKWCVCVTRWKSALEADRAAPVDLEATHSSALEFVTLEDLKAHALQ